MMLDSTREMIAKQRDALEAQAVRDAAAAAALEADWHEALDQMKQHRAQAADLTKLLRADDEDEDAAVDAYMKNSSGEPTAALCTELFQPTTGSLARCDGLTHDQGFHEGRSENGTPYRWPTDEWRRARKANSG